jgi:hypothetical protein
VYQISILFTYYYYYNISLAILRFAFYSSLYKYLHTKAYRLLFSKNTKLRRRRKRRKNYLKVINRHLAKAAKALIVSKLIAIFYPRDGKS